MGLRAARRRAQEQREARVVAVDGPGARRHRRARCRDPHAPTGLGDIRSRRQLQRPTRRVPDRPSPVPSRRVAGGRGPVRHGAPGPGHRRAARSALPGRRRATIRPAPLQPHVQDVHGTGRGGRLGHLPAPRDGPGLVRQLQERPAVVAQEAAVRDRPDREVVPQRDLARATSCSGCASSSRWRCSTSFGPRARPLRPSRPGSRPVARGTSASASRPVASDCASTRRTSWRTTRRRRSTSSTASRSAGRSSKASTTGATSTCRATRTRAARASSTSTRRPAST